MPIDGELSFVIPTNRLRDVGETVEQYDEHFWKNGHSIPIIVFDDSTPANQEKYFALLEKTTTHHDVYYVGPQEKDCLLSYLNSRLRDRRLEGIVKSLFRPSYGGNRNYTLMHTLGGLMVSSDDDMRPWCLFENSPESLENDEVCRGRLHKTSDNEYSRKSFDILSAFLDVVGKPVNEIPDNYDRGELLVDSAMDLETNASTGLSRENSLLLQHGTVSANSIVKIAQTFRSGTNDIDAVDFLEMFLEDEEQTSLENLNDVYVLVNFRPVVTKKNWRVDCGVAAWDNTFGLPPFFPTRLRFEDYIYRLWIRKDGVVSAHVDAAQHHLKSHYMRNPPAAEIFNEEVCNLLKRKINASVSHLNDLTIDFDYDGEVSASDACEILDKMQALHQRAIRAAESAQSVPREEALRLFAANLEKAFYGFEPDFFQQNLLRIVDDVVGVIKASIQLWPTLVEIAYFEKRRNGLPRTRVRNQKKSGTAH
jgi:hypothetical protein